MVTLQQHFSSMEETVQTLLQNQDSLEDPKVNPLDLMKAYKDKLLEEMWKQQDSVEAPAAAAAEGEPASPEASGGSEENSKDSNPLLERLRELEAENSALSLENDNQRKQYERCLDEVANQVVQALLTQKDLKEECVKLRTRVFDLEQQNRILSVLFQQRVKISTAPVSQDVQRNGKAGVAAGRWPSLVSLTCPRSSGSGSGSDASLSSACSEYSSGSHTWAEGRGFSKQSAASRDKRMRTSSVSSNHSASSAQTELGWKEGHILKGLKCLQVCSAKDKSSRASASHCKDCMTSNEGIYSLGAKCAPQGATAKQVASKSKPFKAGGGLTALDSEDSYDDSAKLPSRELSDQPKKDPLCVEKLDVMRDDDGNLIEEPVSLAVNSLLLPLPVTDNFLFLEGPTVKPGVSLTDTPSPKEEQNQELFEKNKSSSMKSSDRNNNQEMSADRKSRHDHVQRQQGVPATKNADEGTSDVKSPIPHTATTALSFMNEARQRSSSAEVTYCREQTSQPDYSQDHTYPESSHRTPKPQPFDSARKAFILRSKSADGGPDQAKHTHSPLHQKLIKDPRSKGQSAHAGQSVANKRTSLSKTPISSKVVLSTVRKDEDIIVTTSKSLENVQHSSPLTSPLKYPKTFNRSPGVNECPESPVKLCLQMTRPQTSNDPVGDNIDENLPCSPRKQRRQDQYCDVSQSDHVSPAPPPPPGRTTSLLLRPSSDSLPDTHKSVGQMQSSIAGKVTSSTLNPQLCQFSPPILPQASTSKDNQHTGQQVGTEDVPVKDDPSKLVQNHSFNMLPIQGQEYQASVSRQLSLDITTSCRDENCAPSILPSQSILQRSQQSASEPKLSEVLPHMYSNVYYHGIYNNLHSSTSKAVRMSHPVNARSNEAITGQESTFVVFGRQNKDGTQTFVCNPPLAHDFGAKDKGRRKIDTRCNSLDSEPPAHPVASDSGVMLDWGFDEEGWLFKRSVSVSTRPLLRPIMGMNGAKARSQSFGARYMDRPSFNKSGKVRTQIKTHSGSSLNSLGDVLPGSMSCSSSYHCPMSQSLLNNFMIEEGLTGPSYLGSSSERLQNLKLQREQARRIQIEQQFSSAFGEPVSEEPEAQSTITTIEEKVMLGIEENLQKTHEQEKSSEVKQKSGSTLANWFGFRKSKLPAPSAKKTEQPKVKEDKREQRITSLLGGKQSKADKKRDRRKSEGKDCSVGRRESHDAVRACISMPCPGMAMNEMQGHTDITGDPKVMSQRPATENGSTVITDQDAVVGSGCKMRTLDSGIGTIPLPESCSFFSNILHLLPKSSSTPEQPLSPRSVPSPSSEDISPSFLPRWRVPPSFKDSSRAGVPNSLSDSSMTHIPSVPFPTVAFLQPIQPQSQPIVTSSSVCDPHSRLPRPLQGGTEPKKSTYVKSKTRATPSQQKEQTRLQVANFYPVPFSRLLDLGPSYQRVSDADSHGSKGITPWIYDFNSHGGSFNPSLDTVSVARG